MGRHHSSLVLAVALSCGAGPAAAAEVWVDAATGSDSNAGTEQEPFATLERGCSEDSADAVLVVHVRPGTYREFFETRRPGTHILVEPADQGTVVLTGSEASASLTWTQGDPPGLPQAAAGQVWWADLSAWELAPQIVTHAPGDGSVARLTPAREPDWEVTTEWKHHEHWETAGIAPLQYWADETPAGELSAHYLSAPFLANQWGDLTGGRIWVKDAHSGHDTYAAEIINHWVGEGTVELHRECHISSGEDGLGADSKFYVENAAALLDQEGEWFFDEATSRLYLWPPGGADPQSLDLEIARRQQGISIEHGDFLIEGMVLRGFNYEHDHWNTRASALFVHTSSDATLEDVTIRSCTIEHASRGIHAVASTSGGIVTLDGLLIEDSRIAHTDGQGINVQSWPNDTIGPRNVTVQRCHLEDLGFRNPAPTDSMCGVSFARIGDFRFLDNELERTPHNGMCVSYGCENVLIKGNHFHHCGLNAADNGCVKFWNNIDHFSPNDPRSILATENLVHDSMGWAYASEVNEWWQTTGLSGSGFYCDYYKGATFYRNVIHTVGATALWPNTPSNRNWMINNTVLNARHGASCSRQSMSTPEQGQALVQNNLFMNFTTWGFPEDHYWGQLESGVLYSRTDELLSSHHNAFHDVLHDMLYVDDNNNGNKYTTVQDVTANTPYEQGSIDIGDADDAIIADAAAFDVHPVAGSAVLDAADELPPEMADLFTRVGLTLTPPEGAAYDIGAIEGAGGPWLRVTFPNGGEILPTGGEATVTWESAAFVGPVRIELATTYSDTPEWQTLVSVTTNDGAELVALPAIHDPSCRIRISELADENPTDLSDADFEIGDAILVTTPAGGETLAAGETFEITWSSGGVTDVDIELSRDGGTSWESVAAAIPAGDRTYSWTVAGPAASDCVVRLSDSADDDPFGLSGEFTIVDPSTAWADEDDGCGCRVAGRSGQNSHLAWLALLGLACLARRRRVTTGHDLLLVEETAPPAHQPRALSG